MIKVDPIAVVGGVRTPFAKAFGELAGASAVTLGKAALTGAVSRCGIPVDDVDEVVFGNVAGPPDAANIARVIALSSNIPPERVAHTVNRNCASGIESVIGAWHSLALGRSDIVVAGGTESMSQIPLLVRPEAAAIWMKLARSKTLLERIKTLFTFRPRHFKPIVGVELGLTDPVSGLNMGQTAEILAKEFSISRDDQDAFAMASHRKAETAQKRCFLSGEIVPMEYGNTSMSKDNAIRYGQSMESLSKLRPIFERGGTVTAGNSCPLTDGAAAMVVCRSEDVSRFSGEPLGYVTSYAVAGCDPRRMGLGPVFAMNRLFNQTGFSLADFDLIEINEAFAAQVIACERAMQSRDFSQKHLGRSTPLGTLDRDRLNIHGGAIALGHPVGTTGTRLILTMLRALRESGGKRGLVTLCVGGGQGAAVIVETEMEKRS
ncbi:Acetyl-CoA acetyltransferase [Rubripirellula tenax]|uniref:Acetyl-CoA acetyltransferase n=1 Tax=Rubripirellula tenax TaxID=2528015 RepID=A0A5C6EG17_9BACT|nr:thiolase family protein [Rubripirellula tenax]TWU47424.1 Acetyl-CoA acetyltransferase [Rubripirellula tenax]